MIQVTSVHELSTGYIHVRFGDQIFVQWPKYKYPSCDDVFGGFIEDRGNYAKAAESAWRNAEPSR